MLLHLVVELHYTEFHVERKKGVYIYICCWKFSHLFMLSLFELWLCRWSQSQFWSNRQVTQERCGHWSLHKVHKGVNGVCIALGAVAPCPQARQLAPADPRNNIKISIQKSAVLETATAQDPEAPRSQAWRIKITCRGKRRGKKQRYYNLFGFKISLFKSSV